MEEPESKIHLFSFLCKNEFLWMHLQYSFQIVLIIPSFTLQSAIFGFTDHKVKYHLIDHILLIFKHYDYKTRENGSLELKVLKQNIYKIRNFEKRISLSKPEKRKNLEQKWKPLLDNTEDILWNIWWWDSWVRVGVMSLLFF